MDAPQAARKGLKVLPGVAGGGAPAARFRQFRQAFDETCDETADGRATGPPQPNGSGRPTTTTLRRFLIPNLYYNVINHQ